jgi:membrane-associated phospholipid phosphatase
MTRSRVLAWPGLAHVAYTARRAVLVTAWFAIAYGGADYLTARRSGPARIYFAWELAIPFWLPAILLYDSQYVVFLIAPFVLRTKAAIDTLAASLIVATTAAGLCFLVAPCQIGFVPPSVAGPLAPLFVMTDAINLDYNLVPSLHVAFAGLCAAAFGAATPRWIRALWFLWASLVALSTLLTHQHHVVDVATGVALAWASARAARMLRRPQAAAAAEAA